MNRGGRHLNRTDNGKQSNARFDVELGVEKQRSVTDIRSDQYRKVPRSSEEGNSQAALERVSEGVLSTDFGSHIEGRSNVAGGDDNDNANSPPPHEGPQAAAEPYRKFDLANAVNQSYSRAAKLLRESLGASGVAFVDASHISTTATATRRRSLTPSDEKASTATGTDTNTDASEGGAAGPPKMCNVMGISTFMETEEDHTAHIELSRRDLSTLIRAYPRAKVFSFMRNGDAYSSSEASEPGSSSDSSPDASQSRVKTQRSRNARILRNVVGKGGSIMFYPIFDDKTERWRSALIIWAKASSVSRFFDQNEDVTYCSAFAHSLRADLARIETAASDAAKGTFMSSISHELQQVGLRLKTYVYRCVYADNSQYVLLQNLDSLRPLLSLHVLTYRCEGSPLHGISPASSSYKTHSLLPFKKRWHSLSHSLAGHYSTQ
jgi:hypothetical protein